MSWWSAPGWWGAASARHKLGGPSERSPHPLLPRLRRTRQGLADVAGAEAALVVEAPSTWIAIGHPQADGIRALGARLIANRLDHVAGHSAARALAAADGISLGSAVSRLVERGLRPSGPPVQNRNGFPVIGGRGDRVITDEMVADHRDD